jgi:hypothetical protein
MNGKEKKTYATHPVYGTQKTDQYNAMRRLYHCLLPPVLAHTKDLDKSNEDVDKV